MSEHGYSKYANGCRCVVCREAKAAYMRRSREQAARRLKWQQAHGTPGGRHVVEGITHGLAGYQNRRCRCEVCSGAKAQDDAARYRAKLRSGVDVSRAEDQSAEDAA